MNPGSYNLNIYRGDTKRWRLLLWSDAAKTVPADLTGAVASSLIRDKAIKGTFQLPITCAITLPNIIDMSLTSAQSQGLPAVGVWDVQVLYPSSDVFTILSGDVIVTQDVTYT